MNELIEQEKIAEILAGFYCTKDKDIENFLRTKALDYEKRNWSSTYILFDEQKMQMEGKFQIAGYFTLANKILEISDNVSKTLKKKIMGGLKKYENHMHFILIGQLGKYICETKKIQVHSETTAYELLDKAFEIIYQVKERIVCRNVLLECKDEVKIKKMYEEYGFKELQRDGNMIQYIMKL